MREVVIVDGFRTPLAKFGTDFATLNAVDLGTVALRELMWKSFIEFNEVDEVIAGEGGASADAANPARIIARRVGLSDSIPAYTVQRNCASGMQAIVEACKDIALSHRDVTAVLGVESMSSFPVLYPEALRQALLMLQAVRGKEAQSAVEEEVASLMGKHLRAILQGEHNELMPRYALQLGLIDPMTGFEMGTMADVLAREFGISREAQDAFALLSHKRASDATRQGRLTDEIVPVYVHALGKFVHEDNGIRHSQTLEALAKLKPYFDPEHGTVTAGNASQVTDGAAAMLVVAKDVALSRGWPILAEIIGYEFSGCEPMRFGIGPVRATSLALQRAGLSFDEIKLIELNEAFAAQVIAVERAFASGEACSRDYDCPVPLGEIDRDILNVNGGAVALGHPIGATGVRIVLTLAKEMARRNTEFGLATICIGGGQGGAMILRRPPSASGPSEKESRA